MPAFESWGRLPKVNQQVYPLHQREQTPPLLNAPRLPYGNGRSYGDVGLNDQGWLLATRGLDRFIAFNPSTGVLQCEAGVLLSEIIALVLPQGFFLAVTPGTQFVTVGGAIANDVHGKNHHCAGTFGEHVLALTLLRSSGECLALSPGQPLFHATVGGMGLTGLITQATLQLQRISSPFIAGDSIKFANLAEFFTLSAAAEAHWQYTVAWVDCAASGSQLGRGIFMRGNPAPALAQPKMRSAPRVLRVPFDPPISLINRASLTAFNTLYYGKQRKPIQPCLWHWQPFFYPLDAVLEWNRIYGPRGFYQYQCVVPPAHAQDSIAEMLKLIARSGQGSFLAVLKVFGTRPAVGLMSFPRPGATLALDFPNLGEKTLHLLSALDCITRAAGGAVYPAKDARMSRDAFADYFPRLPEFLPHLDPQHSSSFWRRVQP